MRYGPTNWISRGLYLTWWREKGDWGHWFPSCNIFHLKAYLHPQLISWALQPLIDFTLTPFCRPITTLGLNSGGKNNRACLRQHSTPLTIRGEVFQGRLYYQHRWKCALVWGMRLVVEPNLTVSLCLLLFGGNQAMPELFTIFVSLSFYRGSEESGCPLNANKLIDSLCLPVTQNEAGYYAAPSCQMNLTRW